MSDGELSEDDKKILESLGYGASQTEGKQTVHTFLHNVATANDTTKLGYLKDEEIGNMQHPIRTYKVVSVYADKILGSSGLKDIFGSLSEITTSTSLSRNGFLTKLAVVTKREISDVTKEKKENKGWFKRKDKTNEDEMQS